MPFIVACPCGKTLRVADEHAGRKGRCPACGRVLDIPAADAPLAAADSLTLLAADQAVTRTPAARPREDVPSSPETDEALAATPLRPQVTEISAEAVEPDTFLPPSYRLYSPGHVALATFFSNVLGGCILLALNYRALGQARAAWRITLFGLVAVAVLVVVIILLPDPLTTPVGLVSAVVSIVSMYQLAKWLQGRDYDRHVGRGGQPASGFAACGIGLLCGLATVGVAVGCGFAYDALFTEGMGQKMVFGAEEEVYYTGGVSETQARAVGQFLQRERYFDGLGGKTVQVSRNGDGYSVAFVIQQGHWDKPDVVQYFQGLGRRLSREVFDGKRLEVRLCDEWLSTKKTIPVTGDPAGK
jgi:hypothetical protein